MAADDELPRGWGFTAAFSSNQLPQLTMAAIPGIAHVLTYLLVVVYTSSFTAGSGYNAGMGIMAPLPGLTLGIMDHSGAIWTKDEVSWSGKWATPVSQALTVGTNATIPTNTGAVVIAGGYDT
jgi:hypothetical protein